MTYQIRVTDPDGSNSIILDKADNITYHKVINSPNEDISFDIPTADAKTRYVTETKYWEIWDVAANERKNRGPIHNISDSNEPITKVSGPGRSQLLLDHYQTDLTTFYYPIPRLIDDLRYENLAVSPSTKTYVWDGKGATKSIFFDGLTINEDQYMQYYGLSKQTKDNTIDENDGYILPGTEKPSNTYFTTNSYWAGTDVIDSLIVDLGVSASISKLSLLFPWWGGIQRLNNRGYTFQLSYTNSDVDDVEELDSGDWILLHENTDGRTVTTPPQRFYFFMGEDVPQTAIERSIGNPIFLDIGDIDARYFRILITGTYAWFGNVYDGDTPEDRWGHQCDPESTDDDSASTTSAAYPKMKNKKISDRVLEPQNDCHAGIVEFGAFTTLLERNEISGLVKQRIKSDNKQITYQHTPQASETTTVGDFRKFEPGSFFKRVTIDYSGATSSYTQFFNKDCSGCYSTFHFGVVDDFNSLIYRTTNTSGTVDIRTPRLARNLTMRGSPNATVIAVDAFQAKADPLSWGGSYSYSEIIGDNLVVNFRGASFTWWATIPSDTLGATVDINIREKDDETGLWSSWTVLSTGLALPSGITSEVVFEIPYDTSLSEGISYEIEITNTDGGYLSVDSFGGWWEGSMTDFNEDNERFILQFPTQWKQIYDSRFTNGSMYKSNSIRNLFAGDFQGDRLQVYSAKGRYHGSITVQMTYYDTSTPNIYDPTDSHRVFIPGGDIADGSFTVDLNTGSKGTETPGILIFDSNELSGWKFGEDGDEMDALPWGRYGFTLNAPHTGTYMADYAQEDSDQFVARCSDCNPDTDGDIEINRFIYVDGISIHERATLSSSWKIEKHLDIIASIGEALEFEWDIGEEGLTVRPRIGIDTDIILLEGVNTVINSEIVKDGEKMASQLISSGADIDGLPLFSIVENRKNREVMGRTVQRVQDYRSVADYFSLIGVSRAELVRRREPEYRITVTHIGYKYGLNPGDSFLIKKKTKDLIRVRINEITTTQSKSSGIQYNLSCTKITESDTDVAVIGPEHPLPPGRRKYGMALADIFQPHPRMFAQARAKVLGEEPEPGESMYRTGFYGPAVATEGRNNHQIRPAEDEEFSIRFIASQNSAPDSIAVNIRGGPVYSGGNGGTLRCALQGDNSGEPDGSDLAVVSWSPGNPGGGWEDKAAHSFAGSPAALTIGNVYHLTFTNTHGSPDSNWISINDSYVAGTPDSPRQPAFTDDLAAMHKISGSWSIITSDTPAFDLTYANGEHDGQSYFGGLMTNLATISGNAKARGRFRVSGGDRTVNKMGVNVYRSSGSGSLTIRLENSSGTALASGTVSSGNWSAVGTPSDPYNGSNWGTVTFSSLTLNDGDEYRVVVSCPVGTTYLAAASLANDEFDDDADWESRRFRDGIAANGGSGEKTSDGSTWVDIYAFEANDFQFYLSEE